MMEFFHYSFMIRALIAGGIIGVVAPLIGTFLVAKRYSLIADSLAHVSLAGVAIGLLTGIYPVYTAIIVAVITAVVIERLRTKQGISAEVSLALFLSGGLALSIVLIGLGKGFSVDLFSYLFGSITTVKPSDVWVIGTLGMLVVVMVCASYKELLSLSFDEESALVSGVPTSFLNTALMILTGLTVSIAMRVVGVLLIGALMVIPVITAMQLKVSFKATLMSSIVISLISVIGGLFTSYYFNVASGGTIVLFALCLFFISLILKKVTV